VSVGEDLIDQIIEIIAGVARLRVRPNAVIARFWLVWSPPSGWCGR